MLLNLGAKWNKRGSFQKTTIYYCMLFNLFAYWNETRRTVFKNKTKNTNLLQYVIQLVCILKWNKMVSFQKNPINDNMLLNLCAKWNKRGSFQKTTIYYSMLFNKRGIFQKTTIYYCMIFNLCAYWNETRGTVFKKKTNNLLQYAIQQEGHFSKNNNLLLYDIQLVCVLKWNKNSFQQKWTIDDNMLLQLVCEMKQEGQFSKNNNLLQYAIQLVCVLKWNKNSFQKTTKLYDDSFQKQLEKTPIARNETRGAVFKNQQFITVCYSTCVCIEMKQEGQFSKTKQKTPIYYSMLFNKRGSFEKQQFITVWYSTCVHIEMKQEGQFSTTKKTQIYYSMLFNLCAYWNETRWSVFKKIQLMTICY